MPRRKKKNVNAGLAVCVILVILIVAVLLSPDTAEPSGPEAPVGVSSEPATEPLSDTWGDSRSTDPVERYAEEHNIPLSAWPKSLRELLERNPETEEFVLKYPELHDQVQDIDMSEYENCTEVPLFMQWDTRWGYTRYGTDVLGITGCGPTTLAMVAYYYTRDPEIRPDTLAQFAIEADYCVPGNGSAWTLISEGGEALGLEVEELPLYEGVVMDTLEEGVPIICIMGPGDFTDNGHYIVLVGTEDGMIRINDCNSRERSSRLWSYSQIESQIENLWAIRYPLGDYVMTGDMGEEPMDNPWITHRTLSSYAQTEGQLDSPWIFKSSGRPS